MAKTPDDSTGHDFRFALRMPRSLADAIDGWRRKQLDLPNRSEAVKRLLVWALENYKK